MTDIFVPTHLQVTIEKLPRFHWTANGMDPDKNGPWIHIQNAIDLITSAKAGEPEQCSNCGVDPHDPDITIPHAPNCVFSDLIKRIEEIEMELKDLRAEQYANALLGDFTPAPRPTDNKQSNDAVADIFYEIGELYQNTNCKTAAGWNALDLVLHILHDNIPRVRADAVKAFAAWNDLIFPRKDTIEMDRAIRYIRQQGWGK